MLLLASLLTVVLALAAASGQYYVQQHTTLVLEPLPAVIVTGDTIHFSGRLYVSEGGAPLANKTVYIEYDSPFEHTRILASVTTGAGGVFSVAWKAVPKGVGQCTYNLFAMFIGDDGNYYSISRQYQVLVLPS